MKTMPVQQPKTGMILFSKNAGLMVQVTRSFKGGFDFHVLNGAWSGLVKDGQIRLSDAYAQRNRMTEEEAILGRSDFELVLSVTKAEYDAWYMGSASGARGLIDRVSEHPPPIAPPRGGVDEGFSEDDPDPVFEAQIVVTVLGQADTPHEFANWISSISLEDLGHEMDEGELIGTSRIVDTREVPFGQIRHRLQEIGNDGSFFEGFGESDTRPDDASETIARLRADQGWNETSMGILAEEFIRKNGLEQAFAQYLKVQADLENEDTIHDDGPV